MLEKIDTKVVIIGAGIAGLCISYYLTKKNIPHLILERGEVANTWINERWENFHLVNPNWAIKIPEFSFGSKFFPSKNPDGFLSKIEIIEYIKSFAKHIGSKIYTNENVTSIEKEKGIYKLITSKQNINSEIVIIASGAFGESYIPKINLDINNKVFQIHSSEFKSNNQLPEGGVLVVGSGQSGAQIAEDLIDCKRNVWLAVSKCGRRPRTYRGKDSSWWNYKMGLFDKTVNQVSFKDRWKCSAHTSGSKGGHDINLMDLESQGLNLCGSVKSCSSEKIVFNNDLSDNLKFSDDSAVNWSKNVDNYILEMKLKATLGKITQDNRINAEKIFSPKSISLSKSIKSIIWATGFKYNYDWINFNVVDDKGVPVQQRGITKHKGFYFMGLQWMHSSKSAQFIGVAEDAEFIVRDIISKK
jgi:putative flavoprotein involved in K+ transport|tara:strand:+ start:11607 stop:12851 length:1245 start_codon:yes stop_codon:yes gene_type:complete